MSTSCTSYLRSSARPPARGAPKSAGVQILAVLAWHHFMGLVLTRTSIDIWTAEPVDWERVQANKNKLKLSFDAIIQSSNFVTYLIKEMNRVAAEQSEPDGFICCMCARKKATIDFSKSQLKKAIGGEFIVTCLSCSAEKEKSRKAYPSLRIWSTPRPRQVNRGTRLTLLALTDTNRSEFPATATATAKQRPTRVHRVYAFGLPRGRDK